MADVIDAIVIGSGPNGLAAAIVLAAAGLRVVIHEAAETVGGGVRSEPLTLPGFTHDVCSAVHPFAVASPFFRTLPLAQHGLEWLEPPAMLAHPFDDGSAAVVYRSLDRTAEGLGADGQGYLATVGRTVAAWPRIESVVLGSLQVQRHPFALAAFGLRALGSAESLIERSFRGGRGRALLGGIAAHAMMPLDRRPTAGVALVLGALAHVAGWAVPRGGAQSLANALAAHFASLGGEMRTGSRVDSIDDLPPARAILCDLTPKPFLAITGHRLPASYRTALDRFRYGPGAFKVDWALSGPIPWASAACREAATVHLGGAFDEIAASERAAWEGRTAERPFTLLVQPSIVDSSRAPDGRHVAWAYCHVPHGSAADMLPAIERQIDRFAPGFAQRVLGRHVMTPADLERHNANLVGGDIGGGATDLAQLFLRPTWRRYATPVKGLYLCSASTPPGTGVHGMCGFHAARLALKDLGIPHS